MRTRFSLWLALPVLLLMTVAVNSQTKTGSQRTFSTQVPLTSGWQFRQADKDAWHPATVPGSVHLDLLDNKLIEDPFYRDNEKKLQWIGKTDWEYRTTFKVTQAVLDRKNIELVFEGLDTYADVFLNEKQILKADNMFRTWRVNCAGELKPGDNSLRIRFRSPINEILPIMAKMKYELPASNDQGEKTSPHTRKAPYNFGWDWGPRFVTSGIWRPARLEAWDEARLSDLFIDQRQVSAESAKLRAHIDITSSTTSGAEVIVEDVRTKTVLAKKELNLVPGANASSLDFEILKPQLWWPNGLGAQPLYTFKAKVLIKGQVVSEVSKRTGLRSIIVRQENDSWGKSFEFVVNGVPVFGKGANWIPADSFPTRITKERYRWLLKSSADANMNMLRVWGGGIYETDEFYEICDELGIMVWQDFMFACSMYPGHQEFLDSVRAEAEDNVRRLRNYASIAIWSGNNEVETAWFNWGWRQNLPASIWDDYLKIFEGVLREVTVKLDPGRLYWPSSPHGGLPDDPNSKKSGDVHSWNVWHGEAPFTAYQQEFPRFMSEYGFQSFPQIETVKAYTKPDEHHIQSPVMMAHQKHPRGNQLIKEYMLREYPEPKDFESFLYVSQVLQAEGIKVGAEHLRRIMPRSMGSLYWQLDDCWPVASWSSIDYYGRWKALQYYAKRFYAPILLVPHPEGDNLNFYVVSDLASEAKGLLKIELRDLEGNLLTGMQRNIPVMPVKSESHVSLPIKTLIPSRDAKNVMIYAELLVNGRVVSSNQYYFAPFKELPMPTPNITFEATRMRGGFKIKVFTDKLARGVYLSSKTDGFFSDNYFDMLPGRPVELEFRTTKTVTPAEFRETLKIRSLKDAFVAPGSVTSK